MGITIRSTEAVLSAAAAFPDLTVLVTEEAESADVLAARRQLEEFTGLITLVEGQQADYTQRVQTLSNQLEGIDWLATRQEVDEQVGTFFAAAQGIAGTFGGNQAAEITALATTTGNTTMVSALQDTIAGYTAPDMKEPNKLTRTGMWFASGFEGLWRFVEAVVLAIALESLILLSFTYLAYFVGSMIFTARNEFRTTKGLPPLTMLDPTSIKSRKGLKNLFAVMWSGDEAVVTPVEERVEPSTENINPEVAKEHKSSASVLKTPGMGKPQPSARPNGAGSGLTAGVSAGL